MSLAKPYYIISDFSNSAACSGVYHGQCIDTYQIQCMGMVIPGICGNITHFRYLILVTNCISKNSLIV